MGESFFAIDTFNIDNSSTIMEQFITKSIQTRPIINCLFLIKQSKINIVAKKLIYLNLMRRNVLYLFYWHGDQSVYSTKNFIRYNHEVMRIGVITNPRLNVFRLYYNQAKSVNNQFQLVNWWINSTGLYQRPTLPSIQKVFSNFHGRVFKIPVVHKPPWFFVNYFNDTTIEVEGGRDDKLLSILAEKLNFRYTYIDPHDRNQGSSILENGSFPGALGLIWRREADFFLGDVTISLERAQAVEFSFFTLADSGAFVTHAPSRLNEALALIRPFQWNVWPPVLLTILLSGPMLYFVIIAPTMWNKRERKILKFKNRRQLLFQSCVWYILMIFLRQTGKAPSHSQHARILIIILSLSATYIIGDIYSANMTSLLVKPTREEPIRTLVQLEAAMKYDDYSLFVEKQSSLYLLLENGSGIYGRLWKMMKKQPNGHLVESVEDGIKLVRNSNKIVIMAGRETLYFDIQRFGSYHFYLSEKLYTEYAGIAFQIGCPYIDNFNKILGRLHDGGILAKMTEQEYENLGKKTLKKKTKPVHKSLELDNNIDSSMVTSQSKDSTTLSKKLDLYDEKNRSEPINIIMVQGAFYVVLFGHSGAFLIFLCEIFAKRHEKKLERKRKLKEKKIPKCPNTPKWKNHFTMSKLKDHVQSVVNNLKNFKRRVVESSIDSASILSFDYID